MCIAITPDEIDSFIPYGVSRDKVLVIPNGISESDFIEDDSKYFREKFGLGTRPFILFVGRLNLIKGPDILLKAFCEIKNRFPDVDLIFAGPDGGMLAELESIVKKEKAEDRVSFLGYVGGFDKSNAYHAAMFLAIPSRHEAMSIVVLEAGISGTPVLLTDQCGFNQVAEVGGGWVVAATIESLKNSLIEVLSNPKQIEVAGINLKKYVETNFSWNIIVQEYWKVYSAILADAGI
jgi:glycosyltransferase involved in cell wall biosynthesis